MAHSKSRRRARERVPQRAHHAGVRRPGVRLPISAAPRTVVAVPHSADVRGRSLRRLSLRQRCDNRRAAGDRGGTDIRTSPGQPCYTSGMSLLEGSARGPAQDGNLAAKINLLGLEGVASVEIRKAMPLLLLRAVGSRRKLTLACFLSCSWQVPGAY